VVLALDLYRREGRNPSVEALEEVSRLLREFPIEEHWAELEARVEHQARGPSSALRQLPPDGPCSGALDDPGRSSLATWQWV